MKKSSDGFLISSTNRSRYAFKKDGLLLAAEHLLSTRFSLPIFFVLISLAVDDTTWAWLFQILAIGIMLSRGGINKAIERRCDFIRLGYQQKVTFTRNIVAGAVIFVAPASLSIVGVIYSPYLFSYL